MSSLAATQSYGYYLPPEYYESGAYLKQTRNQFAAASKTNNNNNNSNRNGTTEKKIKTGHNQWLKHGIVRFVLQEKVRKIKNYSFCLKEEEKIVQLDLLFSF
jgi:hypothetical protein